jgi:hypothetical protein
MFSTGLWIRICTESAFLEIRIRICNAVLDLRLKIKN